MTSDETDDTHQAAFDHIREVRAKALEHVRLAQQLGIERRDLMRELVDAVTRPSLRGARSPRQAVQKMLTLATPRRRRFRSNAS